MSLIVVLTSMAMYDSIQHLHHFLKTKYCHYCPFMCTLAWNFRLSDLICLGFFGFVLGFGFLVFFFVKQCNLCKHILRIILEHLLPSQKC